MMKDAARWEAWLAGHAKRSPTDFARNLRICESLYREARTLGVLPRKDPLENIDFKIRFARALNVRGSHSKNGTGS